MVSLIHRWAKPALPIDISDPNLAFYSQFWHPDTGGTTFPSLDINHHTCTVTGATQTYEGRAFDGNDDKIIITGLTLPTAAFTYSFWIYLNPAHAALNTKQAVIVDSGNSPTDGVMIYWDDRGGGLIDLVVFRVKGTVNSSSATFAASTFATAGWYYITCLYDKDEGGTTEQQIRLNASTTVSVDFSETLAAITGNLTLGLQASDSTLDFGGVLGELLIYSRKISVSEDSHNYQVTGGRYQ